MKPDSFRWLPIVVAFFALVISCLSWWEAHRVRLINEEVNRPLLTITQITATPRETGARMTGPTYAIFTIRLKNNGKATAKVNSLIVEPELNFQSGECKIIPTERFEVSSSFEVFSQFEESTVRAITVTRECNSTPQLSFKLRLLVTYIDSGSGREYFQTFNENVEMRTTPPGAGTGAAELPPAR